LSRKVISNLFDSIRADYQLAIDKTANELDADFPEDIINSVSTAIARRVSRMVVA